MVPRRLDKEACFFFKAAIAAEEEEEEDDNEAVVEEDDDTLEVFNALICPCSEARERSKAAAACSYISRRK